jgi:Uma2 family endonuclease
VSLKAPERLYSPEEYLAAERVAEAKSEYVAGHVRAMAGASESHVLISGNIAASLRLALGAGICRVYQSDLRLWVNQTKSIYYPDVMVVCGKRSFRFGRQSEADNPALIAEVLSPSTRSIDRGEKLKAYRSIPTLLHYLVVSQSSPQIEHHWRDQRGVWLSEVVAGLESAVSLRAFECTLPFGPIYEQVDMDTREEME